MSPYKQDMKAFADACETLLRLEFVADNLSERDHQVIQYYIAALAAKFPSLLKGTTTT
jgi:hypothetical protein